ncbi:MAG TPA: S53 family peptidase [Nocardioides sp.]|uniref:S53 family peptidase n=1 Tax=Nocardioides sp. TaxID=35761 RepID=UPI002F3FDD1B
MNSNPGRRLLAVTAAASLAAIGLTAPTGPAAASSALDGWVATHTKAFDATKLGATRLATSTPDSRVLHLAVALKPRHEAAENRALRAMYTPGSASYHHFLTARQWNARYAPSGSRVSAVRQYLAARGMRDIQVTGNRQLVTAAATAAQAERAFRTSLAQFRLDGQRFTANTTVARVPQRLAGTVQAVLGLTTLRLPTPHPIAHDANAGSPHPFVLLPPEKFRRTYHVGDTPSGRRTSIAVFAQGSMRHVVNDLRTAERRYHLPRVPVTRIEVGRQSGDTSGLEEWDMDTQTSTAMALHVRRLYLYTVARLTDSDVVHAFARFVSDDKARAMSASIGGCDVTAALDGTLTTTDRILRQGAMQGQTLFASSGDNGSGCAFAAAVGAPTEPPGTNWPASSTYTTAVGGTSLVVDKAGRRAQDPVTGTPLELGWAGSGGGISEVAGPGWWTKDSDPAYDVQDLSGGRAVPDIALDADPNVATAAAVWVKGHKEGIGGTSLSSPLMLGGWARLETSHHNRLGMAAIGLYRLYARANPAVAPGVPDPAPSPVRGFIDIVLGANGHYLDAPGYDEVTGLGAPDFAVLDHRLH